MLTALLALGKALWRFLISPIGAMLMAGAFTLAAGWGIERHAEVLHLRGVINTLRDALGVAQKKLTDEQLAREKEKNLAERTSRQAIENNRKTEQILNARNLENANVYETKLRERDRAIAGLRAERKRLRDQITAYSAPRDPTRDGPGAACQLDARPERLGSLLAEGADLLAEGGDVVAALSAQVVGLQAYVNSVCLVAK